MACQGRQGEQGGWDQWRLGWQGEPGESVGQKGGIIIIIIIDCLCATHPLGPSPGPGFLALGVGPDLGLRP